MAELTGTVVATTISPEWAATIANRLSGRKGEVLRLIAKSTPPALKLLQMEVQLGRVVAYVSLLGDGNLEVKSGSAISSEQQAGLIAAFKRAQGVL